MTTYRGFAGGLDPPSKRADASPVATQILLVRTMTGATDSDRRESSVPKVKGLADTHDSLGSLCVAPSGRSLK